MTKDIIANNITKQGFLSRKFLKDNNVTEYECYVIIFETPKCKYCCDDAKFLTFKRGFSDICHSTVCKKKHRKEKTEKTCMEKYNVKNISQLDEIKARKDVSMKATCMEKYGVDNAFKCKDIMYKDGKHVTQTKGLYHLDHKFSIYEWFIQNVPMENIGSINNLEMIIGRNNISKGKNCSITVEKLLKDFNEK